MRATASLAAILALSSSTLVLAAPKNPALCEADTVNLIAKTIGPKPKGSNLPNINNDVLVFIHSGAGQNAGTLARQSAGDPNNTAPGLFQNGTGSGTDGNHLTAGYLYGTTPYSVLLDTARQPGNTNPGAYNGSVQFDVGVGSADVMIADGSFGEMNGGAFYACPDVPIEGGRAIAVGVRNRYASTPAGCWEIALLAQCAGPLDKSVKKAFPYFKRSKCYEDASKVTLSY